LHRVTAPPIALALSDNAQQKAFVLGVPLSPTDGLRLDRVGARGAVNGGGGARGARRGAARLAMACCGRDRASASVWSGRAAPGG
jgi:hypothetical protein